MNKFFKAMFCVTFFSVSTRALGFLLKIYLSRELGAVQLGKAYRNEISPRQGVIRLREFTQAEAEIFLDPEDKTTPNFSQESLNFLTLYSKLIPKKL